MKGIRWGKRVKRREKGRGIIIKNTERDEGHKPVSQQIGLLFGETAQIGDVFERVTVSEPNNTNKETTSAG